jgi:hypothetical protein
MSLSVQSQAPYYDDFVSSGNEAKNYLRILFRPGYSVQARELTQLQTILQSQIEKFGRSVYIDGTAVVDGLCTFDKMVSWIDLLVTDPDRIAELPHLAQLAWTNEDDSFSTLNAKVLYYRPHTSILNTWRVYVQYTSSTIVSDTTQNTFVGGESLSYWLTDPNDGTISYSSAYFGLVSEMGYAFALHVPKGVYFIKGCFVVNAEQHLYIDHTYSSPPPYWVPIMDELNGYAAFIITDTKYVTSTDDTSLLDNANGAPNYAAPGAHRYAIDLELAWVDASTNTFVTQDHLLPIALDVSDYVKLVTVAESTVPRVARTEYSNLDRIMAQRTSEESGNYTVRPFILDVHEMFDDGENRGKYTAEALFQNPDSILTAQSQLVVGVEPSVAYVDGYRIALNEKIDLTGTKARTTKTVTDVNLSAQQGSYIEGHPHAHSEEFPDPSDQTAVYELFSGNDPDAAAATIGECRIRGLEYLASSVPTGLWRLYIYNVILASPGLNVTDATYLRPKSGGSGKAFIFKKNPDSGDSATVALNSPIFEGNLDTAIFPIPFNTVKNVITDGDFAPNISLRTRVLLNMHDDYDSEGNFDYSVVLAAPMGSIFVDDTASNYLILIDGIGAFYGSSLSAVGVNSITVTFNTTNVSLSSEHLTALVTVNWNDVDPKTKTLTVVEDEALTSTDDPLVNGDIVEITGVYAAADTEKVTNLVGDYFLNNGQRDSFYTFGSLTPKTGANEGPLTIDYTYFAHGGNGLYFSVDSYKDSGIEYQDIPKYNGMRLSDVIDFRPILESGTATYPVDPNSVITLDCTYYLPRIDSVVVNNVGTFSIAEGIPAAQPNSPPTPGGAMALYNLEIPAYTFSAADVVIRYIDNRRYTMRDIGRFEKRLTNLEYYTSLSLLEKDASSTLILDDTLAMDRFKNGILVDAFIGHGVGDVTNHSYACSMNTTAGALRPMYLSYSARLILNSVMGKNTNTVTLPFTETPLITQVYASTHESVNPYDVASWDGVMELSPSSDEWKSVTRAPDLIVNERGIYDSIANLVDRTNVLGTVWNEWTIAWTSQASTAGNATGRNRRTATTTSTTTASIREGLMTRMSFTDIEQNLGDRILDVSFIPFIRSRKVYFKGKLFKPNTKLFVFIDNVNITEYATMIPTNEYVSYVESTDVLTYEDEPSVDIPGLESPLSLITSATGSITGFFVIPNTSALRFRTGDRTIKFTDSSNNDDAESTTTSSTIYNAIGLVESKQATILSTRTPQIVTERVTDSRVVTTTRVRHRDPLAQSFIIGNIETGCFVTSVDLYFQAISQRSIPVSVHIVSVENGVPTQNIIPFSSVVKDSIDVAVDATGATLPTNFEFSDPIYLQPGVEYALVVMSNDSAYRLWVSEMNGLDVTTGEKISKNPYSGVMFKSQNASTWTPDQNRDFKFTLNRAVFPVDELNLVEFKHVIPETGQYSVMEFSTFMLNAQDLVVPGTRIRYALQFGNDTYDVNTIENYSLPTRLRVEHDDVMNMFAVLSTTSPFITPVIDLDRVSLLGIQNLINADITNEATMDGGAAMARYITKRVDLNDVSDQLDIYVSVNRPSAEANVYVYAKVKTDDTTPFFNLPWTLMASSPVSIPVSTDDADYNEIHYTLQSATEFNAFAVKIVLASSNTAMVPSLRDFRAIATL